MNIKEKLAKLNLQKDALEIKLEEISSDIADAEYKMADAQDNARSEAESMLSEVDDFSKYMPDSYQMRGSVDTIEQEYYDWQDAWADWDSLSKEYGKVDKKLGAVKAKIKELKKGKK